MREITIYPVMNGFVVKAGCQCLAYQDRTQMKEDIIRYIDDPDEAEKVLKNRWGACGTLRGNEIQPSSACGVPGECQPAAAMSNVERAVARR